jgi:ribonuclease Z
VIDALLLGVGAMVPLPDRPLSSLLVRVGGSLVLFDCGEGTQVQMRRFHWGFRRLDAICLSHLHADHVAGLPGLFHTLANAGRTAPVQILGPVGTIAAVQGLRVIAQWLPYDMVIHELAPGDRFELPAGMRGSVCAAEHRVPCLAWRLDLDRQRPFDPDRARALGVPVTSWSRLQRGETVEANGRAVPPEDVLGSPRPGLALGFATDTRPTPDIAELMQGVDLLVSEATYARDDELDKAVRHKHMTIREACQLARSAGVGKVWLTHFSATVEDSSLFADFARSIYPPVEMGYPGLTTTLSFRDD